MSGGIHVEKPEEGKGKAAVGKDLLESNE